MIKRPLPLQSVNLLQSRALGATMELGCGLPIRLFFVGAPPRTWVGGTTDMKAIQKSCYHPSGHYPDCCRPLLSNGPRYLLALGCSRNLRKSRPHHHHHMPLLCQESVRSEAPLALTTESVFIVAYCAPFRAAKASCTFSHRRITHNTHRQTHYPPFWGERAFRVCCC